MRKIPTIFVRDDADRRYVTSDVTSGCAWVLAGEGVPTRKYDGMCVMFDGEAWWARREVKAGRVEPWRFQPVSIDETTGKTVGWEPIGSSAFAKFHAEAVEFGNATGITGWPRGTYELVGPKINGNPEKVKQHQLWAHAAAEVVDDGLDRSFDAIRATVLTAHDVDGAEGIVFHHPDGRMAKIKARDFRAIERAED